MTVVSDGRRRRITGLGLLAFAIIVAFSLGVIVGSCASCWR